MYLEEDIFHCKECLSCSHKENKLDNVKYWLMQLNEQIYSDQPLDEIDFETCLEEICAVVGLKVPNKPVMLSRKETKPDVVEIPLLPNLNSWMQWNNQYLNQLQC